MPAYNFQARFAPFVESGEKPCTIRLPRKRPTVPGDKLYLYTGQRTKDCRLLRVETCLTVVPFLLFESGFCMVGPRSVMFRRLDTLIKLDTGGLLNTEEFFAFFRQTYGLPFTGELIQFLPHPWLDKLTRRIAA